MWLGHIVPNATRSLVYAKVANINRPSKASSLLARAHEPESKKNCLVELGTCLGLGIDIATGVADMVSIRNEINEDLGFLHRQGRSLRFRSL